MNLNYIFNFTQLSNNHNNMYLQKGKYHLEAIKLMRIGLLSFHKKLKIFVEHV